MKVNKNLAIGGIVLFLLVLAVFSFAKYNLLEKKEYVVKFEVGARSGFDLNTSALTFGRLSPGSSSTRSLNISNYYDFPVFVSFSSSKNLRDVIIVSNNDFILGAGERRSVEFLIHTTPDTSFGERLGTVGLEVKRFRGI